MDNGFYHLCDVRDFLTGKGGALKGRSLTFAILCLGALLPAVAPAAVPWNSAELRQGLVTEPHHTLPAFDPKHQDHLNYLFEIRQTCDFAARYQVSDSLSPNFGGLIEAEHLPSVIETDNTQEAIWIWTRWYELTGFDDYRTNIRRAWFYVLRHPAYREGVGQYVWYSVWNCGLGFFAEMKYREVYGDSTYLAYADTCRQYCFANPLNFTSNTLHGNVTALAAGMMYRYALERASPAMRDTALAYGNRVRTWVEQMPSRLRTGNWAMSGGTLLWGLCNSIWREDTVAGKAWLAVYADSVPYFMPSGQWNCSWNIWDANAFRAAEEITHVPRFGQYHQRLTDTLLGRDVDDDGGIPATWTDPQNQDQVWVSTYLDFMGMDRFTEPMFDTDAGAVDIAGIDPGRIYLPGDSLSVSCRVTNYGRNSLPAVPVTIRLPFYEDTEVTSLEFLQLDTVDFGRFALSAPGTISIAGFTNLGNDQRRDNDTAYAAVRVWTPRAIAGHLRDSLSGLPFAGRVELFLGTDTVPFRRADADTSGEFSVTGIDTSLRIRVRPAPPYPDRQWNVRISSDTSFTLRIPPAQILLVDNDTLSRWETFYTSTFDTLNLSYCIWRRRSQGPLPVAPLAGLAEQLVVWYTGNSRRATLDQADMDSLSAFLDAGGRLFITGQDIGQELSATRFYQDRLHARLRDTTLLLYYAFGNRGDSLGQLFSQSQTAGTQGANNQTSRDGILPDSLARAFLYYDTLTRQVAGICHHDATTNARVIYLGFGFEALNRPTGHPTYESRVTFFRKCHDWLIGASGIADPGTPTPAPQPLSVWPNPFPEEAVISYAIPIPGFVRLRVFSKVGALVRTLSQGLRPAGAGQAVWDGRDDQGAPVSPGVYICRLDAGAFAFSRKLVRVSRTGGRLDLGRFFP